MSNGIFGIGLSGLYAAQAGLLTTGHNISNVNTPGYTRQQTIQATAIAQHTASGFIGSGTTVSTVRRIYSEFLNSQALQQQSAASHLDTYSAQTSQLDNLFGDTTSGLSPALSDFFAGVNAVAANPADIPSRQTLLSSAQGLVGRFQQLDQQLTESRTGVNTQITSIVGSINSLSTNIADLNRQISLGNASSGGQQPPNDLLDQRDELLTELNQQIGATSVAQNDGSINVFLPNGQALVVGETSYKLTTSSDNTDPTNLQVGLVAGSAVVQFHASDLKGGALGGLLEYRDNVLNPTENALGRIALVVAKDFNAQHKLGQDLNGALGTDFFSVPTPAVQNALSNTGTVTLSASVTDPSALTTSDYNLAYDGTNYTVTRTSDNTTQTFATLPHTIDGVSINLASGAIAAGDTFQVQPTRNAAANIGVAISNPANIAAATPISTSALATNTGLGSISAGSIDSTYAASALVSPVTLTYNSGAGTLSGFPATQAVTVTSGSTSTTYPAGAPVPYTAGSTISFGGISVSISGTPANGDVFRVSPNSNGNGDSRNAGLLATLQTQNLIGNSTTLGGGYGQLVSYLGNAAHQGQVESVAQDSLLAQVQQAQQSVSGVNLDEEAANLQRYQQAYQAAGKVLAMATTLFDTILNITN
jgi:flagellar hook-associated protein 1